MADILTQLGTVVTETLSWVGDICTTIVEQPFLLLTAGFLAVGAAIGVVGRLLSRG